MRFVGRTDPYYLELMIGLILLVWTGFLIALPDSDIKPITTEHFYEIVTLHHRFSFEIVGVLLALFQVVVASCWITKRVSKFKITAARLASSTMQCWFWASLTSGLFQATRATHYLPPGFALYGGIALSNGVLVFVHVHRLAECLAGRCICRGDNGAK